jgi:hypothetical protein
MMSSLSCLAPQRVWPIVAAGELMDLLSFSQAAQVDTND